MRSQTFLRKSQRLFAAPILRRALFSCTGSSHLARNKRPRLNPPGVFSSRLVSSTVPSSTDDPFSSLPETPDNCKEPSGDVQITSTEETDKPKSRRAKVSSSLSKDSECLELPEGLDILWLPDRDVVRGVCSDDPALPPTDVFEEALNNLLITLHPQTQHRATYSTAAGAPIEPTLGLFCPIEGGDYVIDATVRELARQTGAEVLVLDSVQLAAGEWGQFGRSANCLQLPKNPLHFPSTSPSSPLSNRNSSTIEDEDGSGEGFQFSPPQQMTLTLLAPSSSQGRALVASSSRRNATPSKAKVFFDAIINTTFPSPETGEDSSSSTRNRPRIVYIRDFPTLGPSSSVWYPPLLSSVQQRRRGPISRPSSAVANPMTIIFGMTPPLTPSIHDSNSGSSNSLMSLLMSRGATSSQVSYPSKHDKSDWSEGEAAEKAREKRLRDRLKKWEKGDAILHEEFPRLFINPEDESGGSQKPEIIVIGGNGMPPPSLVGGGNPGASRSPGSETIPPFFRESVLVPTTRSPSQERETRVKRRREINELSMRMGVGAVGGSIESTSAALALGDLPPIDGPSVSDPERMWDRWGSKIEVWTNVRKIADRAVGSVMAARVAEGKAEKVTLDSTVVPWSTVNTAWVANKSLQDKRKRWAKDSSSKTILEEVEDEADTRGGADEVTERVRNNSDLDQYEQRLLPCIVDSSSMPTSFSHVHLPPHTIDSVRTIVSLPLLHPRAFQQGILKEHGMTGCLLFGPPGTGKTLVVRALAKEAGCRMITISPSDVMDMYVGEGEKLVRAVFSLARRLSPCVVFLDEIDALFGARMSARESGGAIAHRGVITEFMQEMDGLKSSRDDSVIVIGATNRPFDLDDAVLRRLPRRLLVDLPGEKEREEILKILLRDESLADDIDIQALSKKTETFSGSDLKHLCVSAALDSVKENVQLPWSSPRHEVLPQSSTPQNRPSSPSSASVDEGLSTEGLTESTPTVEGHSDSASSPGHSRTLHLRNFTKALKEITPSSSESLGSLSELRKWNEEFGEGRRDKKKRQVWGKDRFGFVDHGKGVEEGKVSGQLESSPPMPSSVQ